MRKSDQQLEELQSFLAEGQATYGAGTAIIAKNTDGRRIFTTEDSKYTSTDEFDGGNPFCGIVRVVQRTDGQAVWNGYYHGWLTDKAAVHSLVPEVVFNFLRMALQQPLGPAVWRGPVTYKESSRALRYENKLEYGQLGCFYGSEAIYYADEQEPIYYGRYGGGLINLSEDTGEV